MVWLRRGGRIDLVWRIASLGQRRFERLRIFWLGFDELVGRFGRCLFWLVGRGRRLLASGLVCLDAVGVGWNFVARSSFFFIRSNHIFV
jgi:hypothetical protein